MRHNCKCLFGCDQPILTKEQPMSELVVGKEQGILFEKYQCCKESFYLLALPKPQTLFEECIWRPFVDTQTPDNSTWDAEERGLIAHKSKIQAGHVCGGNKLEAMYIDTRRVSDDKPWHETGELLTKNTPLYDYKLF